MMTTDLQVEQRIDEDAYAEGQPLAHMRTYAVRLHEKRRDVAAAYVETGLILMEAKAKCGSRANWEPFLESVGVHPRQARRFMFAARAYQKEPAKMLAPTTVRKLLVAASEVESQRKPRQVIDVQPVPDVQPPSDTSTDTVSTDGRCAHCGAPDDWRALAAAQDCDALMLAATAEAEAKAA